MNCFNKFLIVLTSGGGYFPMNAEENLINWKGQVIGITRLPVPWYAPKFLVAGKMKASIPEYSAIKGLQRKYYSIEADTGLFGGVYLWENERSARDWWNEAFFMRINKTYGSNNKIPLKPVLYVHSLDKRAKVETGDNWTSIRRYSIPSESFGTMNKYFETKIQTFQKSKGSHSLWVAGVDNSKIEIITLWANKDSMRSANFSELILPSWKEEETIKTRVPVMIHNQ